jgi:hypothetical protein
MTPSLVATEPAWPGVRTSWIELTSNLMQQNLSVKDQWKSSAPAWASAIERGQTLRAGAAPARQMASDQSLS